MVRLRVGLLAVVLATALAVAGCGDSGGDSSPTKTPGGDGNSTTAAGSPVATKDSAVAKLEVKANPNPVPFSGRPTAPEQPCHDQANTWFWDNVISETAGVAVSITSVTTTVDSNAPNTATLAQPLLVAANGSFSRSVNMCFPTATASHSVTVTYKGTDANGNTVSGAAPAVTLSPK